MVNTDSRQKHVISRYNISDSDGYYAHSLSDASTTYTSGE